MIKIYTDGACRGNPGPGGWGAVLVHNDVATAISGAEANTTNNRMELTAAIKALNSLPANSKVTITTDSNYVKNGITIWIHNWIKGGWLNSNRQPVKNRDLWQQLHTAVNNHQVEWRWIKGHSGHARNEQADLLATTAIDKLYEK